MSDSKQSILVSIVRKAVGLPTGAQSCCGAGAAEVEQSSGSCCGAGGVAEKVPPQAAASCCGGGAVQVKRSSVGCCDAGARAEQSGGACC